MYSLPPCWPAWAWPWCWWLQHGPVTGVAGAAGLVVGMLAALAYLQVTALGRAGEPELRVVFTFMRWRAGGAVMSLVLGDGLHPPYCSWRRPAAAVGTLASLAQLCITRAHAIGRPLVNACLHYLGIVFAYMLGVLFFHDPVTISATLGVLLIIGAGVAATWLRGRLAPAPRTANSTQTRIPDAPHHPSSPQRPCKA